MNVVGQIQRATQRALERLFPRSARTTIHYVTIDGAPDQGGHEPNFEKLRAVAEARGLTVERRYMADVDVADPSLLLLFLAGSWPEWIESRTNAAWAGKLEALGDVVRTTNVPILAVCGSHQLVAQAYAGWGAIGHVRGAGDDTPRSIARERETGESLIPSPRLGEVGVFPLSVREGDPLFDGIGPLAYVMEHHHDEVIDEARSPAFVSLADPDLDAPSVNDGKVARSRVQALRLEGASKILYTLQFHPELVSAVVRPELQSPDDALLARADADGERLLHNFIDLAEAFWRDAEERSA